MELNQDITSQTGNQSDKYTDLIDKIFSCTNEHLMILIKQMLDTADNTLFDLAEKPSSDEEQMKYMDCTRIFRTEKNDINGHFFINLNNSLKPSMDETPGELGELSLSLVGQDEMEEMVAITTMHAKALNIYGEEITNLETRLEYLEIYNEDMFHKEALNPKHICEVFQKTIENLEIDIDVKLVFYKLFDHEVCSKLGIMYKTINQVLIDNGIMPEIILNTTKQEEIEHEEDEVSSRVATYYNPEEEVQTDFIPRSESDVSHIVNQFMRGDMTISENEIELPESFLLMLTQQDIDGKNGYDRKKEFKALT